MFENTKRLITGIVVPGLLIICIFMSLPLVCGHGHSHEGRPHHDHDEPPSYKWSKEANELYKEMVELTKDERSSASKRQNKAQELPKSNVWVDAIGATFLISIAPYLILFIIPLTNKQEHEPYLKVLLAFASGGLLGDAFLHLIPHALIRSQHAAEHSHSQSHGHSHSHFEHTSKESGVHDMSIGISVLAGIIVFLIVEKFVRIFKGGHGHSHCHSNEEKSDAVPNKDIKHKSMKSKETEKTGDSQKSDHEQHTEDKAEDAVSDDGKESKTRKEESQENVNGAVIEDHKKKAEKKEPSNELLPKLVVDNKEEIKVAGYLNLAADFTHNLTDGLAIGASFLAGKNVGVVTTLTIFLHEIPHEIGDFAILLQSGCSKRKAMMLQLITAIGALSGTLISLLAEGAGDAAITGILPFTAGGFIYIATVSVIPELLENSHLWQSLLEVLALLSGVGLMIAIVFFEEENHSH